MSTTYPRLEMKSALEHFSTQGNCLKMTTGSGELDSLIDGIQEGLCYLFYGDTFPLDAISHRLLVNCILSIKEHGFESMVIVSGKIQYSRPYRFHGFFRYHSYNCELWLLSIQIRNYFSMCTFI